MNFLLDQGLPRSAIEALAERGLQAQHVGDMGMARAGDEEILETARGKGAVVVTLDADFHTMLAINHATNPSVIRIRIEGLKGESVAQLIENVLRQTQVDLERGAAVTVNETRVRVRLLPLV